MCIWSQQHSHSDYYNCFLCGASTLTPALLSLFSLKVKPSIPTLTSTVLHDLPKDPLLLKPQFLALFHTHFTPSPHLLLSLKHAKCSHTHDLCTCSSSAGNRYMVFHISIGANPSLTLDLRSLAPYQLGSPWWAHLKQHTAPTLPIHTFSFYFFQSSCHYLTYYLLVHLLCFPLVEYKLQRAEIFPLLYLKDLEQRRYSSNICWINEFIKSMNRYCLKTWLNTWDSSWRNIMRLSYRFWIKMRNKKWYNIRANLFGSSQKLAKLGGMLPGNFLIESIGNK